MTAARLLAAGLVIHLLLILPAAPMPAAQALLRVAPELPLILLGLACLAGAGMGMAGRVLVALGLALLAVQKIADLAMMSAFGRPFNVLTDTALIGAGWDLLTDTVGGPALWAASAGAVVAAAGILWAVWWACGVWSGRRLHLPAEAPPRPRRAGGRAQR